MILLVLLTLYMVGVKCDSNLENKVTEKAVVKNETGLLVERLRERLMKDNYDYQTIESDEPLPLRQHDDENDNDDIDDLDTYNDVTKEVSHDEHVDNLFVPRAHDDDEINEGNSHAISKKDLLYYVDDARLGNMRRANNQVIEDDLHSDSNETNNTTTRKVKYKVFKVRNKNPNRRSGTMYQRIIQEEGADGIALMPLDDGPLPQFRLPQSRRQYMHDHNGFSEDESNISDPVEGINNETSL